MLLTFNMTEKTVSFKTYFEKTFHFKEKQIYCILNGVEHDEMESVMTRENYKKLMDRMQEHPEETKALILFNKILTGTVFLIYPLFLGKLVLVKHPFVRRAFLVPAISFAAVSVFRRIWNAPRPYETFGIAPALKKETKGKSFPSRHVFSVFIIAMTVFYLYPVAGAALGAAGIAMALLRVFLGVHEPRDVAAGALAGIASGLIGYYLI